MAVSDENGREITLLAKLNSKMEEERALAPDCRECGDMNTKTYKLRSSRLINLCLPCYTRLASPNADKKIVSDPTRKKNNHNGARFQKTSIKANDYVKILMNTMSTFSGTVTYINDDYVSIMTSNGNISIDMCDIKSIDKARSKYGEY